MLHFKRFFLAPYSVEQMFNLINDINSYNQFIPGCRTITILKQGQNNLIAEIIPIANNYVQSIVTHNFFVKNKNIIIFLIKGPFKYFYGCWYFIEISENVSRIEYTFYYEFQSIFFEKIFNRLFHEIYKNITHVFISRAHQVYDIF